MSDDLNFHYKRDERLSMRSAPRPQGQGGGFLRGGRRSGILLFNLLLIIVLLVLYSRSLGRAAYSSELAGCRVTLSGAAEGEDVEAALEATTVAAEAAGQRIFVVFRAGEAELRLSQLLPALDGTVTISGRLLAAGRPGELLAEVSVGAKSTVLRRPLTGAGR